MQIMMMFSRLIPFRGMVANSKMDWFKALLAASALIAASGAGYYFFIYLPARDKVALEEKRSAGRLEAEQQAGIAEAEQQAKIAAAEQPAPIAEAQQPAPIADCVHRAEIEYTATWNSHCASQAKKNRDHYANCIAQRLGRGFCQDYYGEQSAVKCGLPRTVAQAINDNLHREKELCYQQSR